MRKIFDRSASSAVGQRDQRPRIDVDRRPLHGGEHGIRDDGRPGDREEFTAGGRGSWADLVQRRKVSGGVPSTFRRAVRSIKLNDGSSGLRAYGWPACACCGYSLIFIQWICNSRDGRTRPSAVRIWIVIWSSVAARFAESEPAIPSSEAVADSSDISPRSSTAKPAAVEPLDIEALHLVERGTRRDLERMKSGRRAHRGDLARGHHGCAGIERHPVRPRQVLAELHVRLAAVLQEPDRAPRAHDPIDDLARMRRAEHERDDEQERDEPAHGRSGRQTGLPERAPGAQITSGGTVSGRLRGLRSVALFAEQKSAPRSGWKLEVRSPGFPAMSSPPRALPQ